MITITISALDLLWLSIAGVVFGFCFKVISMLDRKDFIIKKEEANES